MSDSGDAEIAKALGIRLLARKDVFPVQGRDGAYRPASIKVRDENGNEVKGDDGKALRERIPMKMKHLRMHLTGELSIGHYLIEPSTNTTKIFAFDIDADKGPDREAALAFDEEVWARMLSLGHRLASWARTDYRTRAMVSYGGGKGLHVLCPVRTRVTPEKAKLAAETLLSKGGFVPVRGKNFWASDSWSGITVEIFPKQTEVGSGGFGNLMRLPLGTNRKTGNEAYFVPAEVMNLGVMDDPLTTLSEGTWR